MSASVCVFDRVHKSYRSGFLIHRRQVLSDVSFSVEPGETFAYLGHNGAGKTTSIKALLGLIRIDGGRVELFGARPGARAAHARLGYLPENPYFYDHLTARELLRLVADLHQLERREAKRRIEDVLDVVGLRRRADQRLRQFSKGMLQRIGLAQALLNDPDLLVLDEPMGGLDPMGRFQIRSILGEMKDRGKTLFLSSHILSDVEAIADRAAILSEGRLRRVVDLRALMAQARGLEIHCRGLAAELAASFAREGLTVARRGDVHRIRVEDRSRLGEALERIMGAGGHLLQVVPVRASLEEIFLDEVGAPRDLSPTDPPAGDLVARERIREIAGAVREEVRS